MGSSYFYMEFLLAWVTLLKEAGFRNPSIFALEYSLVPDAVYPVQVEQTLAGYDYAISLAGSPSRVCVAGDSAGATLILSLLLRLGNMEEYRNRMPALAVMISPWVTVISENNTNTSSDYLDSDSLDLYGTQYIGDKVARDDPRVSPGKQKDLGVWANSSPSKGWFFSFGSEEVLGPECRGLIARLKEAGSEVYDVEEQGFIHAWPVASLYLGETREERLHGLRKIVEFIVSKNLVTKLAKKV